MVDIYNIKQMNIATTFIEASNLLFQIDYLLQRVNLKTFLTKYLPSST